MVCLGLCALLSGCARPGPAPLQVQEARGCVFLLPGVESGAWQFRDTIEGLRDAGVSCQVEVLVWGDRFRTFSNLANLDRNRQRATRIAGQIAEHARSHPGEPVVLLGFSGGGGVAVLVAESMPSDVPLDRLILVGAALSPRYDLSRALEHVRGPIVNLWSESDWFILGWGTRAFGTIDRVRTNSAGRVGFLDEAGRPLEHDRVLQIAWTPEWRQYGHNGGHIGWLSRAWAREVLAGQMEEALARGVSRARRVPAPDAHVAADPSGQ